MPMVPRVRLAPQVLPAQTAQTARQAQPALLAHREPPERWGRPALMVLPDHRAFLVLQVRRVRPGPQVPMVQPAQRVPRVRRVRQGLLVPTAPRAHRVRPVPQVPRALLARKARQVPRVSVLQALPGPLVRMALRVQQVLTEQPAPRAYLAIQDLRVLLVQSVLRGRPAILVRLVRKVLPARRVLKAFPEIPAQRDPRVRSVPMVPRVRKVSPAILVPRVLRGRQESGLSVQLVPQARLVHRGFPEQRVPQVPRVPWA